MKRHVVVSSAQALRSDDQVALAALVDNGPTKPSVFRDRSMVVKVATPSGSIFQQGQTIAVTPGSEGTGGSVLGGRTLFDAEPDTVEA